jgi:hypothetical protein
MNRFFNSLCIYIPGYIAHIFIIPAITSLISRIEESETLLEGFFSFGYFYKSFLLSSLYFIFTFWTQFFCKGPLSELKSIGHAILSGISLFHTFFSLGIGITIIFECMDSHFDFELGFCSHYIIPNFQDSIFGALSPQFTFSFLSISFQMFVLILILISKLGRMMSEIRLEKED